MRSQRSYLASKCGHLPSSLAIGIPSLASRVFRAAPEPERKLGCQIIVAAVHPTENLGDAPWPRTYVWTFSYPQTFLSRLARPHAPSGRSPGLHPLDKTARHVSARS